MLRRRRLVPSSRASWLAATVLVVTACTGGSDDGDDGEPDVAADGCVREEVADDTTAVADTPAAASAGVVAATHVCLDEVVVVAAADDVAGAAVAAVVAADAGAPLLLDDGTLDDRLAELAGDGDPQVVRPGGAADGGAEDGADSEGGAGDEAAGDDGDGASEGDATAGGGDVTATALTVADDLGVDTLVVAHAERPADLTAAAATAIRDGGAVLPVSDGDDVATLADGRTVVAVGDDAATLVGDLAETSVDDPWAADGDAAAVWLVDPRDATAASALAVAAARGDAVAPVDGDDLRRGRERVARVRAAVDGGARAVLAGTVRDPDQLAVLLDAPQLPGGGLTHFDGTRLVALYGHPGTPSLGALGEQDLDATFERAREVTAGYDADGRDVVPTLEVIVTLATGDPQDDGSYSRVNPPEEFRELVDRAAEEEVQVILDLQPGRTDFLTQAQVYEELLREPHVGLALDPEWRLEDDQVHLEQIGGVDAAEVQQVVDWYAELTRDAGLSEGLLVLHQFRLDMLRDRDTIEIPLEVAGVVHADGQGERAIKLDTWAFMTAEGADQWLWGWKNFYDEDPETFTADEVLDLDPEVVLVTYQ